MNNTGNRPAPPPTLVEAGLVCSCPSALWAAPPRPQAQEHLARVRQQRQKRQQRAERGGPRRQRRAEQREQAGGDEQEGRRQQARRGRGVDGEADDP